MKTVDIAIEGMHCGGCVKRATDALKKVAGVTPVTVGIGHARVQFDEAKATPDAAVAALEKLGFDARVAGGPA
jgi:copper chaperone